MPGKKGTKGKKRAPRCSEEEEISLVDVSNAIQYNPDIISSLLTDLEEAVESKCDQISKELEFGKLSIERLFQLELIKLPTQVKQMSLARFREEFGDSLEAVTKGAMAGYGLNVSSSSSSSSSLKLSNKAQPGFNTASKQMRSQSKVFQTPLQSKSNGNGLSIPETPSSRMPKEGEMILSVNGSPLGCFDTVVKAPKTAPSIIPPPTPGIFVPLGTGEVVSADELEGLSEDVKQEALVTMQQMMDNMKSMMQKLGANV